jgi:hypothetical protein
MIENIQDFAAYFGVTTPTELHCILWKHDSHISSATLFTAGGKSYCTEYSPEYNALTEFPSDIVSITFNASKEGCDYEPTMTPLVFPFPEEHIDEAIDYLNSELDLADEWGEDYVEQYVAAHSTPLHDKWGVV